jgi:hypothetical protein
MYPSVRGVMPFNYRLAGERGPSPRPALVRSTVRLAWLYDTLRPRQFVRVPRRVPGAMWDTV